MKDKKVVPLFFNVQSQVVCHGFPDVWFIQVAEPSIFGKVKDWRFFTWLVRCLDMVVQIQMINVSIISNASARSMSREMQRLIDAPRLEFIAMRVQIDAIRL